MHADAHRAALLGRARLLLAAFTVCLVAAGMTAIPVQWELETLAAWLGAGPDDTPADHAGPTRWIVRARNAARQTLARHPFLAYGTDWLAFAHVVLGVLFIGAIVDPAGNRWVITFGMVACALVIPWALVFGHVRGIPMWWRVVDCGFGVVGIIPLFLTRPGLSQVFRVLQVGGGSKEDESEAARHADEIVGTRLLSEAGPWLATHCHRHFWAWS